MTCVMFGDSRGLAVLLEAEGNQAGGPQRAGFVRRAGPPYDPPMEPTPIDRFLVELAEQAREFYGDRLVSLAVFGSHASGRAEPRSDVDLFLVLAAAAPRRRLRLDEFDRFEETLLPAVQAVENAGWSAELNPVIRTREEAEGFSILYLDMTVHVRILFDRDDFLRRRLERMRAELRRLGAERRTHGNRWYWVLKKDYRPGEVFEIS
jgi:hypothetical protein